MRLVAAVREGSYTFHGVSETTMTHGEGWRFVQLGKFTERACAVSHAARRLLRDGQPGRRPRLDCAAHQLRARSTRYCRVFTADLQPDRIAEFLLVHAEFPYSVRYSVERMYVVARAITAQSRQPAARRTSGGSIGRLRSSLAFATISELLAGDLHAFLNGVLEQCRALHAAVHDAYIDYPIEIAFEG